MLIPKPRKTGGKLATLVFLTALVFPLASAQALDCKRPAGGNVYQPKVVNFDFDSAKIRAGDKKGLKELAVQYADNPSVEICVLGMTDRSGNEDYNMKLAMKRAEVVADFLKSAGLKASNYQVVARGQPFGDDHWLGKLLGDGKRESDRRVEVLVMQP